MVNEMKRKSREKRASEKQILYITRLKTGLGLTTEYIEKDINALFGRSSLLDLSSSQAAKYIDKLKIKWRAK